MSDKKPPPALFDPLGNRIPTGSNPDMPTGLPKNRVLDRNAGCWNCLHFDTGLAYDMLIGESARRQPMLVQTLEARGVPHDRAQHMARVQTARIRDGLHRSRGHIGVCNLRQVQGDFVSSQHLCDRWDAKVGASLARAPGEALSPLVEEAYDRLGESVPRSDGAPPALAPAPDPAEVASGHPDPEDREP